MMPLASGVQVWLAAGHTDMRRGFDGLALLVQETLKRDPHGGHLFVFRGRRGGLIKVLWHDGEGMRLFAKRLERGRFIWPSSAQVAVTITPGQLGYDRDRQAQRRRPTGVARRCPGAIAGSSGKSDRRVAGPELEARATAKGRRVAARVTLRSPASATISTAFTGRVRCGRGSAGAAETLLAAAEARRDPDFVIKSRTDTLATHGIDEVIRRLNAYAEAGADLLFADAVLSVSDIAAVVKNVPKPICVNMGFGLRKRSTTPLLSARQMEELGVGVAIFPRLLASTAIQGMKNGIAALQQSLETGEVVERADLAVSFEELDTLGGFDDVQAIEKRFLTREQPARKYGTPSN